MTPKKRLFAGVYPCGIVYADRSREECGDYKRLGFLSFATLELELRPDCPMELRRLIRDDAAGIQARRGELYPISTTGQTALLGSLVIEEVRHA